VEAVLGAFFGIGAAITLLTGKSILFSGFRQVAFGLLAAVTLEGGSLVALG
jgi:VIT1/CCC1 family predicted Fe2+/Mn2+ transporter